MSHVLHRFVMIVGLALGWAVGLVNGAVAAPLATEAAMAERSLGRADAPVTMLDFSSLTCPHCADFHLNTLPQLKTKYIDTGKLRLVFRDFPLDRYALQAAMLARCADPGLYFGFVEVLFKTQSQWARASNPGKALAQIGALGGIPEADFDACMNNKELFDKLLAQRQEIQTKYDVQSTPTFVFNDGAEKIQGALPVEKFEEVIDRLLSSH
jgi:protein-disulfide isomerase